MPVHDKLENQQPFTFEINLLGKKSHIFDKNNASYMLNVFQDKPVKSF